MIRQLKLDPARLDDIDRVHQFVDALCDTARVDDDIRFALKLSVEEAYSNIVMHGYRRNPGPVMLVCQWCNGEISVSLRDRAPRFSPDQAPAPDLEAGLHERKIGGLGWYLIQHMMDQVRHEFVDGGNVYTLIKRLPSQPAS